VEKKCTVLERVMCTLSEWILEIRDRAKWWDYVNTIMTFGFLKNKFLDKLGNYQLLNEEPIPVFPPFFLAVNPLLAYGTGSQTYSLTPPPQMFYELHASFHTNSNKEI
jgi:hypothetical protein